MVEGLRSVTVPMDCPTTPGQRHGSGFQQDVRMPSPQLPEVPCAYAAIAPAGAVLFTAGACPLDSSGSVVAIGDLRRQAEVAVHNLLKVLSHYRAGPEHLVRTTIYVVGQRDDLRTAWDVVAGQLKPHRPPSTLLGVSLLGYEGQLIEIDGIAALSGQWTTA
jgi:enamine deaminase RidA (YjgF/YER057c/UK114 family)